MTPVRPITPAERATAIERDRQLLRQTGILGPETTPRRAATWAAHALAILALILAWRSL